MFKGATISTCRLLKVAARLFYIVSVVLRNYALEFGGRTLSTGVLLGELAS